MKHSVFSFVFLFLTFVVTLPISWWGLAANDFFYSSLHDGIGIDEHIQQYAPKNLKNKTGFEKTSKAERVSLFHSVVTAIHNKGKGLASLSYTNTKQQSVALFTEAEVVHLKDVAILLEKLKPVVIISLLIWLAWLTYIFIKRVKIPSTKQLLISAAVMAFIAVIILSFGPEKLFNQLHIWAFPDDHQWFFYYEESLMSTMMKAPDLFAYISVMWVIISILITIFIVMLLHLFQSFQRNSYF